jgi:hypothetical protein
MHTQQISRLSAAFAALALLFCCTTGASAAVTALPAVQLSVNGSPVDLDSSLFFIDDLGFWVGEFEGAGQGWSVTNGHATLAPDPFIDYGFSVKNFTNAPQTFQFTFSVPFTDGPYNLLTSSHSSTVTDGGPAPNGAVDVTAGSGFSFVHNPQIDGVTVAGTEISTGCSRTGPLGFSGTCQGDSFLSVAIPPTGFNGTLSVIVSFTVSARDLYGGSGQVTLSAVPEPQTSLALLAGMIVLLAAMARRRIR